jgi:hypothetical protein
MLKSFMPRYINCKSFLNQKTPFMKKLVFILALGTIVSFSASAQNKKTTGGTSLSIGAEVALPTGDLNNTHKLGLGGSAKLAIPVVTNGDVTISAGYITFAGKDIGSGIKFSNYNIIPVKAGFRYSFDGGFYLEPQLGYSFVSFGGSSDGAFTYAPNIGYMINRMVDISARYEAASKSGGTVSHIGFRIAYNFSLSGK